MLVKINVISLSIYPMIRIKGRKLGNIIHISFVRVQTTTWSFGLSKAYYHVIVSAIIEDFQELIDEEKLNCYNKIQTYIEHNAEW